MLKGPEVIYFVGEPKFLSDEPLFVYRDIKKKTKNKAWTKVCKVTLMLIKDHG